jgi:hypothetical protein
MRPTNWVPTWGQNTISAAITGLETALKRENLSYYNNWGAVWLWRSNRERLTQLMQGAEFWDLFIVLQRSLAFQKLWSWDLNKTYPIRAAQMLIAKRMQEIWLPLSLQNDPGIINSIGLPNEVIDTLLRII